MTAKGVNYVLQSKRQYPEWLRAHTVFKEMNKIDKVFPKIGLSNFSEDCDILNSNEALAEAGRLGSKLMYDINATKNKLFPLLDTTLRSDAKDRNEICAKMQNTINLLDCVYRSMQYNDYNKIIEGKVVMRLRSDIFSGGDKNPTFRKDEAILRVVNKLWEMCKTVGVECNPVDQLPEFKNFSRVNIPNKKYKLVFSSTGEDGAWDIGTISMRGVISCQSWNAPQSRGLIGSISSKFVGVIYVASEQDIPGYGNKMLNRSLVRFAIHKTTKKPALILDRMYPNPNADTIALFKKALKEKSGLEVYSTFDADGRSTQSLGSDYYIPDEPSRKFLKQGEFSYMDFQIPVQQHMPSIRKNIPNITSLTDEFKKAVSSDISKMIIAKREMFLNGQKALEKLSADYVAAKKKWEEENASKPEEEKTKFDLAEPEMDTELKAFGKGGIMNLLTHCDKKHGNNSAGTVFANIILNSFDVPSPDEWASREEYHRKYLMTFLKNSKKVKETAKTNINAGSWMKSFPKSADKFFEYVFSQMRGYVLASCKEMIKKAN